MQFEETNKLFNALIRAHISARWYATRLRDLHEFIGRLGGVPDDMRYRAPEEGQEQEAIQRRRGDPAISLTDPYWFIRDEFDRYHREERALRRDIDTAKLAAVIASSELDSPREPPLDRTTVRIRYDLAQVNGAVPYPLAVGDYPPEDSRVVEHLTAALAPIAVWIERIRALIRPEVPASADPAGTAHVSASVAPQPGGTSGTPGWQHPEGPRGEPAQAEDGAVRIPNGGPRSNDPAASSRRREEPAGLSAATALARFGRRLEGWDAILDCLGGERSRKARDNLRALNQRCRGPIRNMGKQPVVLEHEFTQWYYDIDRQVSAAADAREAAEGRQAERRRSHRELTDRGGLRAADLGMHMERRPNARGKARPAPDGA